MILEFFFGGREHHYLIKSGPGRRYCDIQFQNVSWAWFGWLFNDSGMPQNLKTMKFIQLSFKTRVRQNSIGNTSWRSPGSIFIDCVVAFGDPGVIFVSPGASALKVTF